MTSIIHLIQMHGILVNDDLFVFANIINLVSAFKFILNVFL